MGFLPLYNVKKGKCEWIWLTKLTDTVKPGGYILIEDACIADIDDGLICVTWILRKR